MVSKENFVCYGKGPLRVLPGPLDRNDIAYWCAGQLHLGGLPINGNSTTVTYWLRRGSDLAAKNGMLKLEIGKRYVMRDNRKAQQEYWVSGPVRWVEGVLDYPFWLEDPSDGYSFTCTEEGVWDTHLPFSLYAVREYTESTPISEAPPISGSKKLTALITALRDIRDRMEVNERDADVLAAEAENAIKAYEA